MSRGGGEHDKDRVFQQVSVFTLVHPLLVLVHPEVVKDAVRVKRPKGFESRLVGHIVLDGLNPGAVLVEGVVIGGRVDPDLQSHRIVAVGVATQGFGGAAGLGVDGDQGDDLGFRRDALVDGDTREGGGEVGLDLFLDNGTGGIERDAH